MEKACNTPFLESSATLEALLRLANTEFSIIALKIWMTCLLFGKRKDEMTKTEIRELRDYSFTKATGFLRQLNRTLTSLTERFVAIPEEALGPLIDGLLPFAEDYWGFMAATFKSVDELLEHVNSQPRLSSKGSTIKRLMGTRKAFRMKKLRKSALKNMRKVIQLKYPLPLFRLLFYRSHSFSFLCSQ